MGFKFTEAQYFYKNYSFLTHFLDFLTNDWFLYEMQHWTEIC